MAEKTLTEKLKDLSKLEKDYANTMYNLESKQMKFNSLILNALTYGGLEQGKIYQLCSDSRCR